MKLALQILLGCAIAAVAVGLLVIATAWIAENFS
jgi:hypothetical protein